MTYAVELYNKSYPAYLQTRLTEDAIKKQTAAIEKKQDAVIAAQMASSAALHRDLQTLGYMTEAKMNEVSQGINQVSQEIGFVSRQIGEMGADINMGFSRLEAAVRQSTQAICAKLDEISDILKDQNLTQSRGYLKRAFGSYESGFYQEALEEVSECLKLNKKDYIAWFLLGQTYLFGSGEFSQVVNLDEAIKALEQAKMYITPDSRKFPDARLLASEILYHLALAKETKAYGLVYDGKKEDSEKLLPEAAQTYAESYGCSEAMLESRYNEARCYVLLGNTGGALKCLEEIIRKDRRYAVKAGLDSDFDSLQGEFKQLIEKLRQELYPVVGELMAQCRRLVEVVKTMGLSLDQPEWWIPPETPYIDMRFFQAELLGFIDKLEKGIAYEKEQKGKEFPVNNGVLTAYHGSGGDVSIPDYLGVLTIGPGAFKDCRTITSVVIPASVSAIGHAAFSGCAQLTSVAIPASVTFIGGAAFSDCSNLRSVTIPEGVTSIGELTFSGCQFTSVAIPEGVTSIGNFAFSGCPLTSVAIPASVTAIGVYAFEDFSPQHTRTLQKISIGSNVEFLKGDGVLSSGFSINYLFDEFYNSSGLFKKAKEGGTYIFKSGKWKKDK